MARQCDICGKRPGTGNNVSHANNKTKRRWMPNIHRVKALVGGRVKTIQACARCIRSGRVTKVPYNHSGQRSSAA